MNILPKYKVDPNSFNKIEKPFTDRESEKDYFYKKVELLLTNKDLSEIIVFHGVGGIGKSELIKQLKKEISNKKELCIISEIDFQNPHLNSASRSLLELKRNIANKNISLPHFDLAYYILFKKKNPDHVYNDKNPPFTEEASLIAEIIGAFDAFGFTGPVVNIVNFAYKKFKKLKLDLNIKEQLKELNNLQVYEIEERLPAFFSYDIEKAKTKKNYKSFICFFDTYESIYSNSVSEEEKIYKESWIRELLTNLKNGLFIFSSREKVNWENVNKNWNKYINHLSLDCFNEKDAHEYLSQCNINIPEIKNRIFHASLGHPYYLDLCVDTYYQLKREHKKISVDDFATNKKKVFLRFFSRLKRDESETFKLLSVSRFYDEEIFFFLLQNLPTGYPITSFSQLNRFSFIKEKNSKYFMHELAKESFLLKTSNEIYTTVNHLLLNYYQQKLTNSMQNNLFEDMEFSFEESVFHAVNGFEEEELIRWIKEQINIFKKLQLYGSTKILCEIFTQILHKLSLKKFPPEVFLIYADMVHLGGDFNKAVKLIKKYTLNNPRISDNLLLHLKIRTIHHKMFYVNVTRLKTEISELIQSTDKIKFPERYNELLFMLGGNLGLLSGDFEKSRKHLIDSLNFAKKNNFEDFKCRSLRKYADILRVKNHPKLSIKFCNAGIAIADANNFHRYKIYLLCSLAENFRVLNELKTSIDYFRIAEKESIYLGITSWVAHSYLGQSICNMKAGREEKAQELSRKAENIYKKLNLKWGLVNSIIIKYLLNLSDRDELYELKIMTKKCGYKYELGLVNQLIKGKFEINKYHLLFL